MVDVYGGRGPTVEAVTWSLFAICTVLLALRLYVKIGMKRPGGLALTWALIAYVANLTTQIVATIGIRKYGVGNHGTVIQEAGVLRETIIFIWISSSLGLLAIGSGKVAAVMLVVDLQGKTRPIARIILFIIAAINMVGTSVVATVVWFQCSPPHKLWDIATPGNCDRTLPVQNISVAISSISAASDFIIAAFPAFIIWQLNITLRLKIGLSALMGLAMFTGACAIIKVTTLQTISDDSDPTYGVAKLLLWGFTEAWVVLIVTLIPQVFPIRHALRKSNSTFANSRSRSGHVHLPGEELGPGLRGDYNSAYKGRGYVDHSARMPSNSSTSDLPLNDIMMKQDIQIKSEYTTSRVVERTPSKAHSPSRSTSDNEDYIVHDH